MFTRKNVKEELVTVDQVRTVTGNRIVLPNPGRRDGWNLSSTMQIHKAYFTCSDDTILELQLNKKQQELLRKGASGTVRYKNGKLIEFIPA